MAALGQTPAPGAASIGGAFIMSQTTQAASASEVQVFRRATSATPDLFAAVIAVMAQISIPMPLGVPMTMQTFAITLAAVVLGSKLSAMASARVPDRWVPWACPCWPASPAVLTNSSAPPAASSSRSPSWPISSAWAWSTATPSRARSPLAVVVGTVVNYIVGVDPVRDRGPQHRGRRLFPPACCRLSPPPSSRLCWPAPSA